MNSLKEYSEKIGKMSMVQFFEEGKKVNIEYIQKRTKEIIKKSNIIRAEATKRLGLSLTHCSWNCNCTTNHAHSPLEETICPICGCLVENSSEYIKCFN